MNSNDLYIVYKKGAEAELLDIRSEETLFMTCWYYVSFNNNTNMYEVKSRGREQRLIFQSEELFEALLYLEKHRNDKTE